MTDTYELPDVWEWKNENGGKFATVNRPTSGATHEKKLPAGEHDFQLYSLATPNGVKVTVLFEELLALGITEAEYDAYTIDIMEGDQFGSDFVAINPNSKIPALIDKSGAKPLHLFESGAILLHLAEKFKQFIPNSISGRAQCLTWLFWQMGSAPYLGGGFGHFYNYAPEKIPYCIDRFTMEVKRQLDVLDKHLANNQYICGDQYTIADMAIWPWYGALILNRLYNAAEFVGASQYQQLLRWATMIDKRPAVKRGCMVNRNFGDEQSQILERHSAADFEGKAI